MYISVFTTLETSVIWKQTPTQTNVYYPCQYECFELLCKYHIFLWLFAHIKFVNYWRNGVITFHSREASKAFSMGRNAFIESIKSGRNLFVSTLKCEKWDWTGSKYFVWAHWNPCTENADWRLLSFLSYLKCYQRCII